MKAIGGSTPRGRALPRSTIRPSGRDSRSARTRAPWRPRPSRRSCARPGRSTRSWCSSRCGRRCAPGRGRRPSGRSRPGRSRTAGWSRRSSSSTACRGLRQTGGPGRRRRCRPRSGCPRCRSPRCHRVVASVNRSPDCMVRRCRTVMARFRSSVPGAFQASKYGQASCSTPAMYPSCDRHAHDRAEEALGDGVAGEARRRTVPAEVLLADDVPSADDGDSLGHEVAARGVLVGRVERRWSPYRRPRAGRSASRPWASSLPGTSPRR